MASGKTPTKCSKESILIPETGKSNLVLFNCGHIEHQECWEEIRKQNLTHCPYTKQHHFPIIIGLTRIEIKENRQKVLQALDTWKRNKIAQFRKYINGELGEDYERSLYHTLQPSYTPEQIYSKYTIFFDQPHYKLFMKLGLIEGTLNLKQILKWAIHNNQPETTKEVAQYLTLADTIEPNLTPLLLASLYGYDKVAKNIIDLFPNKISNPNDFYALLNTITIDGLNALHYASRGQHYDLANILTDEQINVDRPDRLAKKTPLAYAIERACLRLVALYLHNGANPNVITTVNTQPNITQYTYRDLVNKYLRQYQPSHIINYENFYLAFDYVLENRFHLLDRQQDEKLIPLESTLKDSYYCQGSVLSIEILQQISGESNLTDREELCEVMETIEIDPRSIIELLSTKKINCLYCRREFENEDYDKIYTTEDMLECGFFHIDCQIDRFTLCGNRECQKLIVDVRNPTLITIEETFYHTTKSTEIDDQITQFLDNSYKKSL